MTQKSRIFGDFLLPENDDFAVFLNFQRAKRAKKKKESQIFFWSDLEMSKLKKKTFFGSKKNSGSYREFFFVPKRGG